MRYTADGGASWQTLSFDLQANALPVDLSGLPEGGYFEVTLADTAEPVRFTMSPAATSQ